MYRNIAVALIGGIGDVILSTPLLESLRSAYPKARITYLVGHRAAPALENLPLLDQIILIRDRQRPNRWSDARLFVKIAACRFDLSICLSRADKLSIAFWAACIPTRVGFTPVKFPWMYTHPIDAYNNPASYKHRTEYFLIAAMRLGIPRPPQLHLHFRVTPEEREQALQRLRSAGADPRHETLVAIHPGTSQVVLEKRRWAVEHFIEVARHILQESGRKVILLGGPDEQQAGKDFRDALLPGTIDFMGQLTFRELAAVLQHCHLLVHNDSSPLHLAGALGIPVLAVFGYQNSQLWGPLGPDDRVVRLELPCSPCAQDFVCDRSFECIRQLKPSMVINVLDAMLGRLERVRATG